MHASLSKQDAVPGSSSLMQYGHLISKSCTQVGCVWKEPRIVETIPYTEIADLPFEKPKSRHKRVAHLYSNTIPHTDLQLCEGTGEVLEEVISTEGPGTYFP